ncbi:hypothetical protein RXV86_19445 [Alisedimentitalea sp. MJ-SS2]|uniref:hypothetical protein n=1 Tax=Aliisedimentitalea sp. MJ-SS2 TaxID=3049795 RepID=UPI00290F8B1D|nr:hypothetical protein [Alisedimentitalea sp. MJ-SS2]MDU8929571.1 hypothetical protein [Alisedimentitalea sp. MJ-SS2]
MALLIAMPSLMLPDVTADTAQIVVLVAIIAFLMVFVEYYSEYPSFIEFRFAPPFNRLRFVALFATVAVLSLICAGKTEPTNVSELATSFGLLLGNAIDFPYSPVRLVVLMLPEDSEPSVVVSVRMAAGVSYMMSLLSLFIFVTMVRLLGWPTRRGAFNVWINLPLFDPTAGGDVLARLKRDAGLNIVLGILLPFLIPAVMKAASDLIDPVSMDNPQTLIWTMSAWAFLPASMIMRGIAMSRVADLIEEKRMRAYAKAKDENLQHA